MIGRLRSRIRVGDHGVTIVEVTLTMLILSIILIMAFDFLDRGTKIAINTESQARAEDDMQRALRTVTQHLRGANPIEGTCATTGYTTTYNTCVRFSVPRNESGFGGCARTEFVVGLIDDTNPADDERLLVYDRVEHNASDCGVGTFNVNNRQVLLARVINGTSEPLFRYYSAEGGLIDTATVAGATSVPDAATVSVHLRMRHRTTAKPIEMTSFASLRNNISR